MVSNFHIKPLICILCLTLFALSGCYKEVLIPVYSCPEPTYPKKEVLRYTTADKNNTDSILKAFIHDLKYLDSYSDQLIIILDGYKQKKEGVPILSDRILQQP